MTTNGNPPQSPPWYQPPPAAPQQPPPQWGQQPQGYQQPQAPAQPQPAQWAQQPPPTPAPTQNPSEVAYGGWAPPTSVLQATQARAKQLKEQGGSRFKKRPFLKIMGPGKNGSWKDAPRGTVGHVAVYFAPMHKEGADNYIELVRHFMIKNRDIYAGHCPAVPPEGEGKPCYVCKAYELALDRGDKNPWGRQQRNFTFQGFPFQYNQSNHQLFPDVEQSTFEGVIQPMLFEANTTVFEQIQNVVSVRDWSNCFHPDTGRVFLIEKAKTGDSPMDVEYRVLDLNQFPLPDPFRAGLSHMHNLDELYDPMTPVKQKEFIVAADLPIPPELGGMQAQVAAPTQWQAPGVAPASVSPNPQGWTPPAPAQFPVQQPLPLAPPESAPPPPMPMPKVQGQGYEAAPGQPVQLPQPPAPFGGGVPPAIPEEDDIPF